MFTAFVHCRALEPDPEREDRRSWSWPACTEATVKCFLKAKFSRIYSTHGSWSDFCWRRCVGDVAGMTWESWDGNWLKLEVLLTSLSWWWTLCRESFALIFLILWRAGHKGFPDTKWATNKKFCSKTFRRLRHFQFVNCWRIENAVDGETSSNKTSCLSLTSCLGNPCVPPFIISKCEWALKSLSPSWNLSFSWSAVLCWRSTPAHGDHISTCL